MKRLEHYSHCIFYDQKQEAKKGSFTKNFKFEDGSSNENDEDEMEEENTQKSTNLFLFLLDSKETA